MLTAIKSVNNTTFNDVMHVLKKLMEQDNFEVCNYESCAKVTNYYTYLPTNNNIHTRQINWIKNMVINDYHNKRFSFKILF